MATREEVENSARLSLKRAYAAYPQGCDEDQMREFLKGEEYPEVAYAILTQDDYHDEVIKYAEA